MKSYGSLFFIYFQNVSTLFNEYASTLVSLDFCGSDYYKAYFKSKTSNIAKVCILTINKNVFTFSVDALVNTRFYDPHNIVYTV